MNIKKRTVLIMSVVVIVSFLIGSIVVAAAPEDTGLDALWDALFGLEEDVEELETQLDLQAQIDDLQQQINELGVETGTNTALLDFLEDEWIPGPEGPQGPQGEKGDKGDPGLGLDPIGYVSITPSALTPDYEGMDSAYRLYGTYMVNFDPELVTFYAPVSLPHGVIVTNLTLYCYDDVPEDVHVWCILLVHDDVQGWGMADTYSQDGGASCTYDDSINLNQVDNENYAYFLHVSIPANSDPHFLRFCYAVITYEYPA